MKILAPVAASLALCLALSAQEPCGTMPRHQQHLASNPAYAAIRLAIESHTQAYSAALPTMLGANQIIRIPVVVHVVYKNPTENLSDQQIFSQLDVLNEDFRRLNANAVNTPAMFQGIAADTEIEFCLANIDPQGNPTSGITRTATSVSTFNLFTDDVKFDSTGGKDAWPATDYLNVWVCDLGPNLYGYAQFPGGAAATDGVVVHYGHFGRPGLIGPPYNMGRTLTHEVGHWLNLFHIWGDGPCSVDDGVADTPPGSAPSSGCPTGVLQCGVVSMPENYMDYSDDACMNLFTLGQRTRMRALFGPGGARESLLNSPGCQPPLYQINQSSSGLSLNGVVGASRVLALTQTCVGESFTLSWSARSATLPWDVALVVAPVIPLGSAGALATPGGQIFNLDLTHPSFFFLNGGGTAPFLLPFPGNATVLAGGSGAPGSVSAQQLVLDPLAAEGFALSQPCQLDAVTGGALPVHPAGPTTDDEVVSVSLRGSGTACGGSPITFFGTSHETMHVSSNGRVTFGTPSPDPAASVLGAVTGPAFAGFWTDLVPTPGGSIDIVATPNGGVRVNYQLLLHQGTIAGTSTFSIEFDPTTDAVILDGLSGIIPNTTGSYLTQVMGISPGTPSALGGAATSFAPGTSGSSLVPGLILVDVTTGGSLASLTAGTDTITFTPLPGGGYSWIAL